MPRKIVISAGLTNDPTASIINMGLGTADSRRCPDDVMDELLSIMVNAAARRQRRQWFQ
jgi:hypothetical protein